MPKILVHIGNAKCGSTFMQGIFQATDCHYLHAGFSSVEEVKRRTLYVIFKRIFSFGKDIIISHESIGVTKILDVLRRAVGKDAYVLLVVRSPQSHLKSMYKHIVRKGYHQKFNYWLRDCEKSVIWQVNFNGKMNKMIKLFGEEKVIVMPFEMLVENQQMFFDILGKRTGMCFNLQNTEKHNKYKSLSSENTEILRRFNRVIKTLTRYRAENNCEDKSTTRTFHEKYRRFSSLFISDNGFINTREVNELKNFFTKELLLDSPRAQSYIEKYYTPKDENKSDLKYEIPKTLAEKINKNIDKLSQYEIFAEYLDRYYINV